MKKKTTLAKKSNTAPALRDAHLAALLLYIGGPTSDDEDGRVAERFARSLSAAEQMLTSAPITSAFDMLRERPDVYELVAGLVSSDLEHWGDARDARRAFDAVDAARRDDRTGPEHINHRDVNQVLNTYIESGMLVGACLMYTLLKGGAK